MYAKNGISLFITLQPHHKVNRYFCYNLTGKLISMSFFLSNQWNKIPTLYGHTCKYDS